MGWRSTMGSKNMEFFFGGGINNMQLSLGMYIKIKSVKHPLVGGYII